ncbi:thiamine-binding protein [Chitinophagaceae bacterium MMS25-I14]
MNHIVNLAIQVLPLRLSKEEAYAIVDKAIEVIQQSGLHYVVCPFETVVEGPYDRVMQLLNDVQDACYKAGAPELIINMKLHRSAETDMLIDDKIGKYK